MSDLEAKTKLLDGKATQLPLTLNALQILAKRYLLKDHADHVLETPEEMFLRVAKALAEVEYRFHASEQEVQQLTNEFYSLMSSFSFTPAGRTLANAGGPTKVVSNCIVLHIQDSLDDIFETLKQAALLQKAGSGLGFPLHLMRPAGYITKTSSGVSSGPISFLHVYNTAFGVIKQQNRHGANMAVMSVDHPDILEFIHCKDKEGNLRNFNVSVGLTDEFMRQVRSGSTAKWMCKFHGAEVLPRRVTRDVNMSFQEAHPVEISASDIFREIIECAWNTGEPGCVFLDTVNNTNPLPGLGRLEACNPCVTADTWIATSLGPKQVKDLTAGNSNVVLPDGREVSASAFFSTGVKNVLRVETKEGLSLCCTPNHRLLTTEKGWVEAQNLSEDDVLVVACTEQDWAGIGTEAEGYLVGMLRGGGVLEERQAVISIWATAQDDSHIAHMAAVDAAVADFNGAVYKWTSIPEHSEFRLQSKAILDLAERFGLVPGTKGATDVVESASRAFYVGFLRGMFDSDGSVQGCSAKDHSVCLSQSDKPCLERIQRMLLRLGIMSRISRLLPDGKRSVKEYTSKDDFELIISRESLNHFARIVGFAHPKKHCDLAQTISSLKRNPYKERKEASVCRITSLGQAQVFDVNVYDNSHAYNSNGFVSHNCGEQFLHDGDVCNLGALNLEKFVTPNKEIDFAGLSKATHLAIRMLDNVIELSEFPVEKVHKTSTANRRIGLGVMGFADMLYQLNVGYGTAEGRAVAEQVMKHIQHESEQESRRLAEVKGVFPNWEKSVFAKTGEKRRNAALTNIPPTGTISMMFDVSGGVEPYFALAYYYKNILGGAVQLSYVNKHLKKALVDCGAFSEELLADIIKRGSLQHITSLPEDLRRTFVTSMDITAEQHILMQAAFQKHTDNAISKTINFPNSATRADILRGYVLAWESGCKGCTAYRDGSRMEQVLNLNADAKEKESLPQKGSTSPNTARAAERAKQVSDRSVCNDCNIPMRHAEGCVECPSCGISKCEG